MKKLLALLLLTLFFCEIGAYAANFTTTTSQGSGANWTAAIWQGTSPTAGNTYEMIFNGVQYGANTGNTRIRNPTAVAGIQTFPGDSLTMGTNTDIRSKQAGGTSPILNFPGVNGNPGLILNGGALNPGDTGQTVQYQGRIHVLGDSLIALADNGLGAVIADRHLVFNASSILTGTGSLIILQSGTASVNTEVTSANNTYSGTWIVKAGWLRGTGVGSLGTGNILVNPNYSVSPLLVNPATALTNGPARVEVMYDINTPGTLTLANNGEMLLHQNCTFSAVTVNGTALSAGNHPYSELNAMFPNNFPAGGSGSITVQPPSPPPAPLNVVAFSGDTQVRLSWSAAPNAVGYSVFSSATSGGPYTPLANVSSTGYTNTGLANGTTVYYVIQATNQNGSSPNSAQVSGTPNPVVANLTATGGTGQVVLAWSGLSSGPPADSYDISRSTNSGGPYAPIATGVLGLTYTDTAVQNGTTYFYFVRGNFTGGGTSNPSDVAFTSTAPNAPVLTVSPFVSTTVANLTWTLSDPAIGQFLIERSENGVDFNQIAAVGPAVRQYLATGLAFSTTHTFRIRATNGGGSSPYSNTGSLTTPSFSVHVNFANPTFATNFPGYVNDYSLPYGLRTNGMTYGWDMDNTQHARERNNPISPDKRYDTFTHMQKTTPLPAAREWAIAVPNGFYRVHMVGGESDNADEIIQFVVEGVETAAINLNGAVGLARWTDITLTTTVSDGILNVTNGPLASNNKLCFIDIVAAVPDPIVIGTQPQSQEVEEYRRVTMSVTIASGSTPITYQWYFNDGPIDGGTNRILFLPQVRQADSGTYYVVIDNPAGQTVSDSATLSVVPDVTPPSILSASSLDGSVVKLVWDEPLDPASASDTASYSIPGATVTSAVILTNEFGDSNIVILTLTGLSTSTFDIHPTVFLIYDPYGNGQSADPLATGKVFALGSGLISDGPIGTAADPLEKGSTTVDVNRLEIVAGGSDIWNAADGFRYAYGLYTNDFDMKVRVSRLDPRNRWSKAGFVIRQDLTPGSPNLNAIITPHETALDGSGVGQNDFEAGVRSAAGGATADWGSRPTNDVPWTNAWIRVRRQGTTFKAFWGSNGVDWAQFATNVSALPNVVYVGLATTAHNNGPGQTTTAVYEDFMLIPHLPPSITQQPPSTQTVNQGGTATFSVIATGEEPLTYQWRKASVNIPNATNATYVINGVQANDAGNYDVIVSNPNGSLGSLNAELSVRVPPSITVHPQSVTNGCGPVTFTVTAAGSPILTYQWRKGVTDIQNATGPSYTISSVQQSDAGSYSVVVSNDLGTATSDAAVLTVADVAKPNITCPANITTSCTGPSGATVNFTVTATDNCDPNPLINCVPASGSTFAIGTTTVNCTATDISGNSQNCSFTVTVQDNTAAVLTIVLNGSQVTISWPQTCRTYHLESKDALDDPIWTDLGAGQLMGSNYEVSMQAGGTSKFFHLKSQP